jgi:hypothetical protein
MKKNSRLPRKTAVVNSETHNFPLTFDPKTTETIKISGKGGHQHNIILSVGMPNTAIGGRVRDLVTFSTFKKN